jgi:Flp pilus assembly protein TadG
MSIIKNNRGVAIIYITLFLLILGIVFVAWAIDVGWMVYVRSQSQAAVDAAALRGAAAIPNYNNNSCDTTLVTKMAAGLDEGNTVSGLSATESSIQVCSGGDTNPTCPAACSPETPGTSVRVRRTYSTPLFFSRLLSGGGNTNITVSATAYLGGLAAGGPDLPGAISTCALQLPLSCQLQQVTTDILDLVSSVEDLAGSALLPLLPLLPDAKACDMASGAIPKVEVGQTIGRVPGNCFYKNVKERYCEAMTGKKDCDGDEGTWCYATMPVVDCDNIVTGFTTMCIRKVQDGTSGTKRLMEVVFCCSHTEPGPTVLGPTGGEFYGTYADRPILVR